MMQLFHKSCIFFFNFIYYNYTLIENTSSEDIITMNGGWTVSKGQRSFILFPGQVILNVDEISSVNEDVGGTFVTVFMKNGTTHIVRGKLKEFWKSLTDE